jgi:hypothetical protein
MITAGSGEKAAKVLVEGEAGFRCDAGRIGIDSLEKAADFSPHLFVARKTDFA